MKRTSFGLVILFVGVVELLGGEVIRVATYNVQNYLEVDRWVDGRYRPGFPKPEIEKTALRKVILEVQPDVLILQEMGKDPYLQELQNDLKEEGWHMPFRYVAEAADEERHLALLSRVEPKEIKSHSDLEFEYFGEVIPVKRGLLEAVFETGARQWKVFGMHLKSKWTDQDEDPYSNDRRRSESLACRKRILELQKLDGLPFLILGDLNDTKSTAPVRLLQARGKQVVASALDALDSRGDRWTHFYAKEDSYSRVDYVLKSLDFPAQVLGDQATIYDGAEALEASDHRLVWIDLEWETGR